jgi:hypothetical protein
MGVMAAVDADGPDSDKCGARAAVGDGEGGEGWMSMDGNSTVSLGNKGAGRYGRYVLGRRWDGTSYHDVSCE